MLRILCLVGYMFTCVVGASAQERIALIIGTNRGLVSERQLKFAVSDARRIRDVLLELGRFTEERTYLLANPSIRDIEKNIDELRGRIKEIRQAGRQVEFFFYYSGHGNAEALHVNNTTFPHDSLLSLVETSGANLAIAMVDACYSGALVTRKGITVAPPLAIQMVDTLSAHGTVMLTSSSTDQVSHESADLGGSVFTHHIISALRGAADYDESGTVSLSEAYNYARMQTSSVTANRTGVMQQPSYAWNVKGREEICLSWLSQGKGRLVMHSGAQCPCFVISEPSQTVMSEFFPGKKPVALALPAGRYRVQQVCNDVIAYADVDLSWKKACTLSLGSLKEFPRTSFTDKGPFDRPALMHFTNAGVLMFSGYPDAEVLQVLPVVAYEMYSGIYRIGVTAGYGRGSYKGRVLRVERETVHLETSLKKTVYTARNLTVAFGLQAGVHFNNQRMLRAEEERLQALGYPSIAPEKTAVLFGGFSLDIMPVIANRIPLDVIIGVNDYAARMDDGYHHFIRPHAGIRLVIIWSHLKFCK